MLGLVFNESAVDVIDAGTQGWDNLFGIELTRTVAALAHMNISVTLGSSPSDTARAVRIRSSCKLPVIQEALFLDIFVSKQVPKERIWGTVL